MPRERKPFCKCEPDFVLGDSDAGTRFLELSEEHQLYYLRLWNLCVKKRRYMIPVFDPKTNQILTKFAAEIFISPTKFRKFFEQILAKNLAVKSSGNCAYLKGIREIHAGLVFSDGDNSGNKQEPDENLSGDDAVPRARGESYRDKETTTVGASENDSAAAVEEVFEQAENRPETPAVRLLARLVDRWSAVRSAFPQLGRGGVTTAQQLVEPAVRLDAEIPGRTDQDALMTVAHYLDALDDAGAKNPFGAALTRSRDRWVLRGAVLARLRSALNGQSAPSTPTAVPEHAVCPECGLRFIWTRIATQDVAPVRCKTCENKRATNSFSPEARAALGLGGS